MRFLVTVVNFATVCFIYLVLLLLSAGVVIAILGVDITNLLLVQAYIGIAVVLFAVSFYLLKTGYVTKDCLRSIRGLRRATEVDRKRLFHVLDDVCNKLQVKKPTVYFTNSPEINAMIVNNNVLVVHQGLINFATKPELQAILAHEMGHTIHNDNMYVQYNYILSMITQRTFDLLYRPFFKDNQDEAIGLVYVLLLPLMFYAAILAVLNLVVNLLVVLVERLASPYAEYRADRYAIKIGLGEHLISFGEKMMDKFPSERKNFRFLCTHPTWKKRVLAAKKLLGEVASANEGIACNGC
jgi:Zn-dependent protease with chaperone function